MKSISLTLSPPECHYTSFDKRTHNIKCKLWINAEIKGYFWKSEIIK